MAEATLNAEELRKINAYWHAANYLSVGQIYLMGNPLLKEPLKPEHVKDRLLGHWGASPGLAFAYIHLSRVIKALDLEVLYMAGPGHGAPGVLGPCYLEGSYSEIYPDCGEDEDGLLRLFSNPAFIDPPVPLPELIGLLKRFSERSAHHFWADDISLRDPAVFLMTAVRGHRQVTDVYLLGREMDSDHNRAVITMVGSPESIGEAAIRAVGAAAKHIDLTKHEGEHPRIGAADVVPFIPIRGVTIEQCVAIATHTAKEIAPDV